MLEAFRGILFAKENGAGLPAEDRVEERSLVWALW